MKSNILRMLNEDHYMGNLKWDALLLWATPFGEMGLFQHRDTEIGRENVEMIILSVNEETQKRQLYIHQYDSRNMKVAVRDTETIVRFAGATKLDTKEQ